MTKQEASDLIDLMITRAPELQAAGYRAVAIGGMSFTLAAPEPKADDKTKTEDEEEHPDALHDVWTHGVPAPNGPKVLPKRKRDI